MVEYSGDEFVLGGYDGDDVVSVLVFLGVGDILSLLDVEVASDLGEKDAECHDKNTPGFIDDIP
jgi:hypothetical protein